jgi:hypothetical protein
MIALDAQLQAISGIRGPAESNDEWRPYYIQIDAGITKRFVLLDAGAMEVRAAVINLNDRPYQIRNGTGVGIFAA